MGRGRPICQHTFLAPVVSHLVFVDRDCFCARITQDGCMGHPQDLKSPLLYGHSAEILFIACAVIALGAHVLKHVSTLRFGNHPNR